MVGKIPNFIGSEAAAEMLRGPESYSSATTVKVNPDAPQRRVRETILMDGKTLVMSTPRIRQGFLVKS